MLDEFPNGRAVKSGLGSDRGPEFATQTIGGDRAALLHQLNQELIRHRDYLRDLAQRYNWWQTPDVALQFPTRLVAHVMDLGTFKDISELWRTLGDDCLRRVLENAEAGQFSPRSWHYWHYRLKNVKPGEVPPLPQRRIA